jgi:hypothetical protein
MTLIKMIITNIKEYFVELTILHQLLPLFIINEFKLKSETNIVIIKLLQWFFDTFILLKIKLVLSNNNIKTTIYEYSFTLKKMIL